MTRRATPADAETLSTFSRTCFMQTFGHLYDPGDLETFLDEAYSLAVLRAELEDPHRATWLLPDDLSDGAPASSASQAPIGYVTACPAHLLHLEIAPGDGEIQRFYILQRRQGGGHRTALLTIVLEWLERDGPRTLWIGAWSGNYGAQHSYARHGFEIVDDHSFMVGDHADYELTTRRLAHFPSE